MKELVPQEKIEDKILLVRSKKVMLDKDLAELYGVPTKSLNLAVKRNHERFPEDFMFQLSREEYDSLRFHFETSKRGGRRYLPYAFTENGVAMLSSVLSSKIAIRVNIQIMRTFSKLREFLLTHKEFAQKLSQLERKYEWHDHQIQEIFNRIRELYSKEEKKMQIKGFEQTGNM
jgi:hypothetical protein